MTFCLQNSGETTDLSEQFLNDCASDYFGLDLPGEEGGCYDNIWPPMLLIFLIREHNGTHQTEFGYSHGANRTCHADKTGEYNGGVLLDYVLSAEPNENSLLTLLFELGPVVTTINIAPLAFYQGGIFDSGQCCDEGHYCT